MKKKIVAMCATCAIAALAVGGTLAYFTDQTKVDVNVMTTGDVSIVQHEEERGADGELTAYDADKNNKLVPYTGPVNAKGEANEYTETLGDYSMFSQADNAIDKIVTVENTGSEDCYVRTLFAYEMIQVDGKWVSPFGEFEDLDGGQYLYTAAMEDAKKLGMALCTNADNSLVTFMLDDVMYCVAQYDYNGILESGKTTRASLKQVYLNANAGNEWAGMIGEDGYSILVLSQAVQAEGFATSDEYIFDEADAAFSTAFGGIDCSSANQDGVDKLAEWFKNVA